jgi:poly-gamma-glutamate capsule biosynthesis protein CapA/YwtB (metallophosphatase superfamily)
MSAGTASCAPDAVRLFLAGDVMTGRGIDQILRQPVDPALHEPWVRSAVTYVELAEAASGPVGRALDAGYPWGDALSLLECWRPAVRIVNLETALTTSARADPAKSIHYRMHPANIACLARAGIDCCVLANNHVLDWGRPGLRETLDTLSSARIGWCGAGADAGEAARPACVPLPAGGRLLVLAAAFASSGVPPAWAATASHAGVNYLAHAGEQQACQLVQAIGAHRRSGDLVVVSLHWGGNWGFPVPDDHRRFAHRLIESGAVDVVHGHSSHHVQGIEVVRGKLVLYGCGDFINDYEGIGGHAAYRPDLAVMYLPVLQAASGELVELRLLALRRRRLRLERAGRPIASGWPGRSSARAAGSAPASRPSTTMG